MIISLLITQGSSSQVTFWANTELSSPSPRAGEEVAVSSLRHQAGEDKPGATCRGSCCFWTPNPRGFSLPCKARQAKCSTTWSFLHGQIKS